MKFKQKLSLKDLSNCISNDDVDDDNHGYMNSPQDPLEQFMVSIVFDQKENFSHLNFGAGDRKSLKSFSSFFIIINNNLKSI